MKSFNIYLMDDQPATCPLCGARTEITKELLDSPDKMQYHKCLSKECKYKFILVEDD
jgi:hypothetical protein